MSGTLGDEFEGKIHDGLPAVHIPGFKDMFAAIAGEGSVTVNAGKYFCRARIPVHPDASREAVAEFLREKVFPTLSHHDGDARMLLVSFAFRARNGDSLPEEPWKGRTPGAMLRGALKPRVSQDPRERYKEGPWIEVI